MARRARRDERAQAVALVRGGMTQAAVAARFGVSRQTVCSWCNPRPPKKRKPPKKREDAPPRRLSEQALRAVEMVRSGMSQSAVARLVGVSTIWSAVKTAAVVRVREGMTRKLAAYLASVTPGMVSKWCAAAGVPSPHQRPRRCKAAGETFEKSREKQ